MSRDAKLGSGFDDGAQVMDRAASDRLRRRLTAAEERLEALQQLPDAGRHLARVRRALEEVEYLRRLLTFAQD